MSPATHPDAVREAVGVFDDVETLQAAIDELESSGFDRAELSLLAGEHVVEEKLGHLYEKVSELEDDPKVPRAAYVSTETIGDAEGALIGGLMYVGATAAAGAIVATGARLPPPAGRRRREGCTMRMRRMFGTKRYCSYPSSFSPSDVRAPRAATRGTRDGRLIELDWPDRLIDH